MLPRSLLHLRRSTRAGGVALALALLAAPALLAGGPGAVARITQPELERHVRQIAAPEMLGRNSPSAGLERAARYIAAHFRDAGLEPLTRNGESPSTPGEGAATPEAPEEDAALAAYLHPFHLRLEAPDVARCELSLTQGPEPFAARFGLDFVPAASCGGEAEGELVFAGFGISSRKHRYDDLKGLDLKGKVALILEGEPRHRTRFDGPELTVEASLWSKLALLAEAGVAGVLVARRPPEGLPDDLVLPLDFRGSFARFPGEAEPLPPKQRPPVLEVSLECATRLLGTDAALLAAQIDRSVKPQRVPTGGRRVRLRSATERAQVRLDNVVGVLPGRDPDLAQEHVLLGAHYDHIGVDPRGRIGAGADDNASGVAALLAVAGAMAEAKPRRSVLFVCFAAEEDGLVGSKQFCEALPIPVRSLAAMVNLDTIGRGEVDEVVVLGTRQNPGLEKVLDRARRLSRTGVKTLTTGKGEELWQRSDHYSFHEIGVPSLFFFEGVPISRNQDYHTWRDVPDGVDFDKVTRTARLAFNTLWILAEDDERPSAPRR